MLCEQINLDLQYQFFIVVCYYGLFYTKFFVHLVDCQDFLYSDPYITLYALCIKRFWGLSSRCRLELAFFYHFFQIKFTIMKPSSYKKHLDGYNIFESKPFSCTCINERSWRLCNLSLGGLSFWHCFYMMKCIPSWCLRTALSNTRTSPT